MWISARCVYTFGHAPGAAWRRSIESWPRRTIDGFSGPGCCSMSWRMGASPSKTGLVSWPVWLRPGNKVAEGCTGTKRTLDAATEVLLDLLPETFLVDVALDLRRNATQTTSGRTTASAVEEASRVLFGGSTSSGFVRSLESTAPREIVAAFCLIGSPMACN
mmetsp:Transcript_120863/g.386927  ORF Transcript_120863/g.386927 Transcript_120863/m.386927 type:complete len:162 (-) Transcript_120863:628-1113(-)